MYSINTPRLNIQSCQYCRNKFVEYIGTQAWCSTCQKIVNTIQQELKVVPKLYQSNAKFKTNSAQIKIKNYINEFCNKFGGLADNEQLHHLYLKAIQLKDKKGTTTKNYRQNSAVVVYIHFKDLHKLSIKQYCKKNQLQIKSFNKSYIAYQKIIKLQKTQKIPNHLNYNELMKKEENEILYLKKEEQFDQSGSLIKRQNYFQDQQIENDNFREKRFCELNSNHYRETSNQCTDNVNQQENATIQIILQKNQLIKKQVNHFIQVIFDNLFSSSLYKDKKNLLISQLSERTIQMYKNISLWKNNNFSINSTVFDQIDDKNFYKYFLFLVLKTISFTINQLKYRQIIQSSTGQSIKSSVLKQVIKFYINNEQNLSSSGQSIFLFENSGSTGSQYIKIEQKQSI